MIFKYFQLIVFLINLLGSNAVFAMSCKRLIVSTGSGRSEIFEREDLLKKAEQLTYGGRWPALLAKMKVDVIRNLVRISESDTLPIYDVFEVYQSVHPHFDSVTSPKFIAEITELKLKFQILRYLKKMDPRVSVKDLDFVLSNSHWLWLKKGTFLLEQKQDLPFFLERIGFPLYNSLIDLRVSKSRASSGNNEITLSLPPNFNLKSSNNFSKDLLIQQVTEAPDRIQALNSFYLLAAFYGNDIEIFDVALTYTQQELVLATKLFSERSNTRLLDCLKLTRHHGEETEKKSENLQLSRLSRNSIHSSSSVSTPLINKIQRNTEFETLSKSIGVRGFKASQQLSQALGFRTTVPVIQGFEKVRSGLSEEDLPRFDKAILENGYDVFNDKISFLRFLSGISGFSVHDSEKLNQRKSIILQGLKLLETFRVPYFHAEEIGLLQQQLSEQDQLRLGQILGYLGPAITSHGFKLLRDQIRDTKSFSEEDVNTFCLKLFLNSQRGLNTPYQKIVEMIEGVHPRLMITLFPLLNKEEPFKPENHVEILARLRQESAKLPHQPVTLEPEVSDLIQSYVDRGFLDLEGAQNVRISAERMNIKVIQKPLKGLINKEVAATALRFQPMLVSYIQFLDPKKDQIDEPAELKLRYKVQNKLIILGSSKSIEALQLAVHETEVRKNQKLEKIATELSALKPHFYTRPTQADTFVEVLARYYINNKRLPRRVNSADDKNESMAFEAMSYLVKWNSVGRPDVTQALDRLIPLLGSERMTREFPRKYEKQFNLTRSMEVSFSRAAIRSVIVQIPKLRTLSTNERLMPLGELMNRIYKFFLVNGRFPHSEPKPENELNPPFQPEERQVYLDVKILFSVHQVWYNGNMKSIPRFQDAKNKFFEKLEELIMRVREKEMNLTRVSEAPQERFSMGFVEPELQDLNQKRLLGWQKVVDLMSAEKKSLLQQPLFNPRTLWNEHQSRAVIVYDFFKLNGALPRTDSDQEASLALSLLRYDVRYNGDTSSQKEANHSLATLMLRIRQLRD